MPTRRDVGVPHARPECEVLPEPHVEMKQADPMVRLFGEEGAVMKDYFT
jgi:hypothetical protein